MTISRMALCEVRATFVIVFVAAASAAAQTVGAQGAAAIISPHKEPPTKIVVDPPQLSPRAAVIRYRTENLRVVPVFGPAALALSPRVGHLHVRVDDASWVWAHTSEEPVTVGGLAPGEHRVRLELMTANHQPLDEDSVSFTSPKAEISGATAVAPTLQHQPPASLVVEAPQPEPLERGVLFIRYRAENLDIVPVFGPSAAAVSPRLGHVHVTVDEANWHWVETSRNPIIVQGLSPGRHKILIKLVNANHQEVDRQTVEVTVPASTRKPGEQHEKQTK